MCRPILAFLLLLASASAFAFDHAYKSWEALLAKDVRTVEDGNASRVSYTALKANHSALQAVLDEYSKVPRAEFDGWSKPQQEAFLINAYNAFTIEKILTRYPDLKSIRDFGTVFGNPWKDKFIPLFGEKLALDDIEHGLLRKPGVYNEPRVHVAVVCASIGCPMLRPEPYVAEKLDAQLEDGMRRFLSDHRRNRYDAATHKLEVSMIFKWYGEDFEKGLRGFTSVKATLAKYADQLAAKPEDRAAVREQKVEVAFLDYDWSLNDAKP